MKRKFSLHPASSVLTAVLLLCAFAPVYASNVKEIKVTGSGKKDLFGQTVSVSGNYAIAGACKDDVMGENAGIAYIFRYTGITWEQEAMLRSPDGLPYGHFGYSAAVYDDPSEDAADYAIVGAVTGDGKVLNSGAAYVFKRNDSYWSHQNRVMADDGKRNDDFGFSVALYGDYAIVGACRSDAAGTDAGAAYIFKNIQGIWTQQARLVANDAKSWDRFGWSVSLSGDYGDYAIVGCPGRDDKGIDSGAAYIFQRNGDTWIQRSKLQPPDGAANDFFGFSVSISGAYAIVGSNGDDDRGDGSGSAYLFKNNGGNWGQTAKLTAGDGSARNFFGRSVSVSGNYAVAGAGGAQAGSGAAYIFKNSGSSWVQTEKLTASDGKISDRLGDSVSVSVSPQSADYFRAIAGAGAVADTNGISEAVYFFGNEPASSPAIDISPDTLNLARCETDGPASAGETDSGRIGDREELYGMGLIIPKEVEEYWKTHVPPPRSPGLDTLPKQVDWSQYDSPVKSQGSCGACSVFATVALVENLANQAGLRTDIDLSEQAILSCVSGADCSGGWYWDMLNYIKQFGAVPENCYAYVKKKEACVYQCTYPDYTVKLADFTPTPGMWSENHSADDLRMALQNGPLVVSMRVPPNGTFVGSGYQGGVYNYEGETISWGSNGHAVLLVGYNDDEQSFKVKNSWGEQWGECGYFRIAYDDVTDDVKFGSYACSASGAYLSDKATVMTISNRGTADLKISKISTSHSWLGVSPDSGLTIIPNSAQSVIVSVLNWNQIPSTGAQAQITIASNDTQQPSLLIGVTASMPPCHRDVVIGNIDCSQSGMDLRDAILGMQVLTGINAEGICSSYKTSGVDVNRDSRIGMEEVIYILNSLSRKGI